MDVYKELIEVIVKMKELKKKVRGGGSDQGLGVCGGGGWVARLEVVGEVVYWGCQPRIEGIDKCKIRYCTISRIIKIIVKGRSVCAGGPDLTQNHLKLKKKTKNKKKSKKKLWSERNRRPSDYRSYT